MSGAAFLRTVSRRIGLSASPPLWLAVVAAIFAVGAIQPDVALAQTPMRGLTAPGNIKAEPGAQMLVESDEIVYDYDNNTVAAVGNVKIYYNGYTLEAEKVTYARATGRLVATGNVKMTDPSGLIVYAEDLDITEDFRDGFVASLRVTTPQQTYFAAERAERTEGERTTFDRGVYTACEPCKDNPDKPPLWQVKAKKIIVDQKEKMIYFEHARLEFIGVPVAYVPYFSTPDPSVKRKSGFLTPYFGQTPQTGYFVAVPYYWAMAPNYDLTFTPRYYTTQGFLGEVEWRHRLANGTYTLKMAGIDQMDPKEFLVGDFPNQAGTYAQRDFRGGVRTTGRFTINPSWTFGWDGMIQTDRTFTRNYDVLSSAGAEQTSEIYLTGIRDRSYFDARAMYFQILTDREHISPSEWNKAFPPVPPTPPVDSTALNPNDPTDLNWNNRFDQGRQAVIWPVVDYDRVFNDPILGGELTWTNNFTNLSRDENDPFMIPGNNTTFYNGLAGDYLRGTTKLEWQKRLIAPGGMVFTPFASVQADAFSLNPDSAAASDLVRDDSAYRLTPAAGLEWSWPVLATVGSSSHVFEPVVQVIARPDEMDAGKLPNNDAQSLVWEDSLLFDRDKFSGFDRVEGGTRVNAGIHYVGTFANGITTDALFGQSYNIAGKNSFDETDIADTGNFSGLQSDDSDYVGRVTLDTGIGPRFGARARFDHDDFTIERGEVSAANALGPLTASIAYLFVRKDPNIGIDEPTSTVSGVAAVNIGESWRMFGSFAYDVTKEVLARGSIGFTADLYNCLTFTAAYSETRNEFSDIPDSRMVAVRLALRTLGETGFSTSVDDLIDGSDDE